MTFPDVEGLTVSWLSDTYPAAHVSTELPANLAALLPAIRVDRIGGIDKSNRLDVAVVDFDFFDSDAIGAAGLARDAREELLAHFAGVVGGAVVSRVQTQQGPHWRPYANPNVRRYGATFRITLHS